MVITKDCIQDFIDSWQQYDSKDRGPVRNQINWSYRFRDAGYFCVHPTVDSMSKWPNMHEWCHEQFGREHYSWTGSTFWFETEKAAILFTLRWA